MVLVQDFIFQVYDLGKNLSFELYEFKSLIINNKAWRSPKIYIKLFKNNMNTTRTFLIKTIANIIMQYTYQEDFFFCININIFANISIISYV